MTTLRPTTRLVRGAALAAGVALTVSACALGDSSSSSGDSAEGGTAADAADLSGVSYAVGGKEFDEQLVLCEIGVATLEAAQADVSNSCNIQGTVATRQALEEGEIDLYWEYTGTGWITHLGETTPIPDEEEQYTAVAEGDLAENDIRWLDYAPLNNTYAIASNQEIADQYGVENLTQLAELAASDPDAASICVENEFANRDDGLPSMVETYGAEFPNTPNLATGAIYQAIAEADPCNYGEVFTTDGRIAALDLVLLEDDQSAFPNYNPAITISEEKYMENEGIADVFAPVSEALTTEAITELNRRVSEDGEPAAAVARDWLTTEGFIGG